MRSELAVIGLLLAWLGFGLVGHDPWKPDEAYTFGLVHHIVETGDWVVPTLGGEPFVEKPPLFFITAALFAQLFGQWLPLHDAARLASGFYAGLAFLFLGLTARVLYGSGAAWSAVLLLAGSLGYVVHAHQLITDNALVAGIALGLYGLSIAMSRPALGGALLGTGAGIAFLSKGVLGPGMLGLIALLLPVFPAWRKREYARSLLWAAAAFAPWALLWPTLLYRRSPPLFDEWLWTNNFGRFTGSAGLGGVHDHWLYLKNLPWFALPTLPIAAWALWRALRSDIQTAGLQLPLVAFLVMLAVLSAASSARTLYGLPMLLPLALLAAATVDALPAWLERPLEYFGMWGAALGSLVLWLLWLALASGWPAALAARVESASPGYVPGIGALPLALAIALTAGWLLLVLPAPRNLAVTWAAGIALVWGLAMTLWLPYLDHSKSYRGVIVDMKKTLPKGACVASRNLTEPQRAMFHYFAGVVSLRESSAAAGRCTALLVHTPTNAEPPHGAEWKLAWRGTRPGDDKEHFWLFSR